MCVYSVVQGKPRRLTGWAPVRFLRFVSENDDRSAVRDREGKEAEEVEVGGDEVGGGNSKWVVDSGMSRRVRVRGMGNLASRVPESKPHP